MTAPEETIGAAVSAYLTGEGWTCFHEVAGLGIGNQRADIVATRPAEGAGSDIPDVLIVEVKTCLSWRLLAQAFAWRDTATFVSVATPPMAHDDIPRICVQSLGLGWLVCDAGVVTPSVQPGWFVGGASPRRGRILNVLDALRPEHQDSRPGNASGGHYTLTQERRRLLALEVAKEPDGIQLPEACRRAWGKTPTAQERKAVEREIRMGQVSGVGLRREGRRRVLTSDATTEEIF